MFSQSQGYPKAIFKDSMSPWLVFDESQNLVWVTALGLTLPEETIELLNSDALLPSFTAKGGVAVSFLSLLAAAYNTPGLTLDFDKMWSIELVTEVHTWSGNGSSTLKAKGLNTVFYHVFKTTSTLDKLVLTFTKL